MNNKRISKAILKATFVIIAFALICGSAHSKAGDEFFSRGLVSKGTRALINWNYAEAEKISQELIAMAAAEGAEEEVIANSSKFRARYCFYIADYECAAEAMAELADIRPLDEEGQIFFDRVKALSEDWKDAVEASSDNFIIRYQPGRDEVLAGPALETL